jgi:hypothetical protein
MRNNHERTNEKVRKDTKKDLLQMQGFSHSEIRILVQHALSVQQRRLLVEQQPTKHNSGASAMPATTRDETRQNKVRQDKTRQGETTTTRQDKTRHDKTTTRQPQDKARQGRATTRQDKTREENRRDE